MRLIIKFNSEEIVSFPLSYNEIIQGFIYRNLNKEFSENLHNHGFIYEKRKFKLFTFSRLLGALRIEGNYLKIFTPFKLVISSPYYEMLQNFAENLIKKQEISLGVNTLYIESIAVSFPPETEREAKIKMLSPVTIYSTFLTSEGSKKTYYYNPREREFSELLRANIIKKYTAFYGESPKDTEFMIEPVKVSKQDEKIVIYKGFIIKGWMGKYKLRGSRELIRFAYDAGIGAKNSQGFGCFEIV